MKTDRLISIIMVLLDKKRVSAGELSEMFEVSQRTIYRDVDAISMAGIPITAVPGVGGGFEIMPGYKLDSSVFTKSDLTSLLMGLNSLTGITKTDDIVNAIAKVRKLIPPEQAKAVEARADTITVDTSPWFGSMHITDSLRVFQLALRDNITVAFSYIDGHGNKSDRIFDPYRLIFKNGSWYVFGFCHAKSDFRLFRLSRIFDFFLTDEFFLRTEPPEPVLHIDEFALQIQTSVKLRIHKSIADRILDHCSFNSFTPDGNDHFTVDYPFIDSDYWYDVLLGFGPDCELLSPPNIREKLRSRVMKLSEIYG